MNIFTATQTRFIKDGIEVLVTELEGDLLEKVLPRLKTRHGREGWTTQSRTITKITTDWS